MASSKKHLEQYESNKELLEKMLASPTPKNDWVVTVAFYAALHLVDRTIIEVGGEQVKPTNHLNRNDKVGRLSNFRSIRSYYTALYMESRKSRYECVKINGKIREESMIYLEKIENELI